LTLPLTAPGDPVSDDSVFYFETIALFFSLLGISLVHMSMHIGPKRCPRCRLPGEELVDFAVVHADAPEVFESWEVDTPELSLVTDAGVVAVRPATERAVRRLVQRRETLTTHRCRVCRHTWETGEVELVRGALSGDPQPPGNLRVFPRKAA
jgi:hypothetical protein